VPLVRLAFALLLSVSPGWAEDAALVAVPPGNRAEDHPPNAVTVFSNIVAPGEVLFVGFRDCLETQNGFNLGTQPIRLLTVSSNAPAGSLVVVRAWLGSVLETNVPICVNVVFPLVQEGKVTGSARIKFRYDYRTIAGSELGDRSSTVLEDRVQVETAGDAITWYRLGIPQIESRGSVSIDVIKTRSLPLLKMAVYIRPVWIWTWRPSVIRE
jgi:hypothetical protein